MAKHREIPEGVPSEFVYLLSKAELYVKIGPDRYRKAEAGKMPPQDWSPEELMEERRGDWRQPVSPIRGIAGFCRERAAMVLVGTRCSALVRCVFWLL